MGGLARSSFLVALSLLGLSLDTGVSAQTSKAKEVAPEHKKPVDVFNHIEGGVTVLTLRPAGTVVRKGEWVVEFDSAHFRDALTRQEMAVKSVDAAYRAAEMRREVAEIGVKEWVDWISKEDIAGADAEIAQAMAQRMRAEERAKDSESAADQRVLAEAQIAEGQARARKAILMKYAEAKHIKELEGEVFKAKGEELRMEAALLRERSKEEKLRREIALCRVVAPIDGVVVYLRPVEEGDAFRWGEVVFRIFPNPTPRSNTGRKWADRFDLGRVASTRRALHVGRGPAARLLDGPGSWM
jgi:multidrug resistance efflux pump